VPAQQNGRKEQFMTLQWNPRNAQVELRHNDGRVVRVSESMLTKIDGSLAALVLEAKHAPSVAVTVPSYSSTRPRRLYVNSLTTI
jgi:hypothetical protein